MEDVKNQVEQTTEITEEQQPTTNEQTSNFEDYSFNQEQVDEVVAKRLAREREAFAKKLGVDKYEGVDSFLENYQTTLSENQELSDDFSWMVEKAFDTEIRLSALIAGVQPDHLDRVVKLALAEMENLGDDEDIEIEKTLSIILEEFPMLKGAEQPAAVRKIGQDAQQEGSSKTEVDRYLEKYKNSKYFGK
jgi:hypothetical protein